MKPILNTLLFAVLAGSAGAATVAVNTSGYLTSIGLTAAGSQGAILLNPTGVLGYANYGGATYTPTHSGGAITLNLSSVGSFSLSALTGDRFSDSVSGVLDTNAVRGSTALNTGYRISFVPGSIGSYSLTVHVADSAADVKYGVTQGGNAVGTPGLLPNSLAPANTYDEGVVVFNFTVDDGTEAAATWNFDITHNNNTGPLAIGGASLVAIPEPSAALLGGIGFLALLRRRR